MVDTQLPSANSIPAERPLRVGYILKRYPRFSETFVVNEILAHERAGVEIEIFALRPTTDSHFQDKLSEVRAGVTYLPEGNCRASDFWQVIQTTLQTFPTAWRPFAVCYNSAASDVYQAMALAQLVRQRGIEHLHAHFATSATAVARMAAAIAGVPFSFTAHAKDIFHEDVDPADLRGKIAAAARVITVSDFNLRHLRSQFPDASQRVMRIFNGLDLSDFQYASPAVRAPRILAVGRLVEKKGFADLIQACAMLAARGIGFECEIIGEGEEEGKLSRLIAQLEVQKRVRLVGPKCRADVVRAMQSAVALVAPCVVGDDGNRDGLPTVLLEAMALGTPCISTHVTGVPELVRHEQTGLLVAQRAPCDLADAIVRLLVESSLRVELASNARRLIESEFDIHRNAAMQRQIFAECRRAGDAQSVALQEGR